MATVYSLICFGGRTGKTVTFTDAGDVVNLTNHGLRAGTGVAFSTTGTLPTGLTAATTYYAKQGADANKFLLYPTSADAIAGTNQITFSGTGTGTHTVKSAYFLALTSAELLRYGSAGSERIYDGLVSWKAGRAGASAFDEEICEIGMAWTEIITSALSLTIPSAVAYATPINDAGHNGVDGDGYAIEMANTNTSVAFFSAAGCSIYGVTISCTGVGSGVNVTAPDSEIDRCIIRGNGAGTASIGARLGSTKTNFTNNLVYGFKYGYRCSLQSLQKAIVANNTFTKNDIGVSSAFTVNVFDIFYNNISCGNTTTDWDTKPTGVTAANNAGVSPWATGSYPSITLATTDFADFTNSDYRPALSTSPQVDSGIAYYGVKTLDIAGGERPNYNNGGAEAVDVGADEFDHGFGPHPTADYYGLAFTGLVAGSKVKVFATGTDTERFSAASSATSETWSVNSSGTDTVDYTIQQAGYYPVRVTDVALTGGTSGILSTPIQQTVDRAYVASSGLTINTNTFANTTTKKFGLTTATTGQNWYSYFIEQWIALGDTGEAYANKQFPLIANGPNSFTCLDGWEFDLITYPNSITNVSRDGLRYLNSSSVMTASWAALLSAGVPSGLTVRYQQTDGGTQASANATGNIDQLIQIYGDASHGNFDRRGYLVAKVQSDGYDQAEVDVVGQYGNLEDQLYVIALSPTANGIAAGVVTGVTITDHGASPVTWNSKVFSITITDTTGHTGEQIQQYVRGLNNFNYHDLVQTNGTEFKTVRGKLYGDTGAALKGVRVVQSDGTTSHTDFNLHTADDGTTYVPPLPPAAAEATILASSRVQLYNVTTATEIENVFVSGTSYSFVITTEASAGDTLRLRACKLGRVSAESFAVWSASGATFIISQPEDTIYTAWGIDGSTVTEFALDGANIQIDANDVDGVSQKVRLGAFYNYALTTEIGIRLFFGAMTFLSPAAIRVNDDVVDVYLDNTNASTALTFSDNDVRLYKKSGETIIAASSKTIHHDYNGVPDYSIITVGGVNVITGDIADIPDAVLSASAGSRTVSQHMQTQTAILANKMVTDPVAGTLTVFDDDNTTPLLTADLFKDAAGTTPYNGTGAERRERLA